MPRLSRRRGNGHSVGMLLLSATTAVLVAAFVTTFGVHRWITDIRTWRNAFDLAREGNVPTWWNTTLLLSVAGAALLVAAVGVEAVNGRLRRDDLELAYFLGTTIEEVVEMGSCIAAVAVILRLVVQPGPGTLALARPDDPHPHNRLGGISPT